MAVTYEKYVKKRKNKTYWRFKAYLGKDELGNDVRTTQSGFETQREAKLAFKKLENDFENKVYKRNDAGNMTFKDLYDEFLEDYREHVKPSTILITRRAIEDHALQYFGKLKIKNITVRYCSEINKKWVKQKLKQAYYFRRIVAQILQFAVQQEYIKDNPMRKTKPIPRRHIDVDSIDSKEVQIYTPHELSYFLECASEYGDPKKFAFFRLLAYTGARKGEILALRWSDLDANLSKLSITKTLAAVEKKGSKTATKVISQDAKTAAGKRVISLDSETLAILVNWRTTQLANYNALNLDTSSQDNLIFPNTSNEYSQLSAPNEWYEAICRKFKIQKRITIHEFRKTHVSLCAMAGMPLTDAMYRVGHKDSKMTQQVYNIYTKEREERSADISANFIEKEKELF
jgi:integrase